MKWISLCLSIILSYSSLYSQTFSELSGKYTNENAVVLEKQTDVSFEFNVTSGLLEVTETVLIKIMGLNITNNISLTMNYDEISSVSNLSTNPYGRYLKTCGDINPDGIFHSGMKMCMYQLKFKVPGEIITCKFTRKTLDIQHYNDIYFTQQYPVIKSVVTVLKPGNLEFELKPFNTAGYNFTSDEINKSAEEGKRLTFTCLNTPGYTQEDNKPPVSFMHPHLLLIPKSYTHGGKKYTYFNGLKDFYRWCKNMSDRCINQPEKLRNIVNTIIAGKTTDEEKTKAIYYWVQDKIRYIAFENGLAGYIPQSAEVVYENKYGDCKGMANLIKTMLSIAGIDSRLTWVGTNDVPYDFSTPSIVTVNHMVCTAILNGKYYILDATNKYSSFGQIPFTFHGRQVLIEDGESFIVYQVPSFDPDSDFQQSRYSYAIEKEILQGSASVKFHGMERSNILEGINSLRTDQQKLLLENIITHNLTKVKPANVQSSDITNKEDAFEIKGNIEVKGQLMQIDDELYIHPDLFSDYKDYFIQTDRISPHYFPLPEHHKTEVSIDIPAGYKIASLPGNYSVKNDFCDIQVSFKEIGNKIVFEKAFKITKTVIPKANFQEWNEAIKQLKKACSQQIIISK